MRNLILSTVVLSLFFGCSASHQPDPNASHVKIYTTIPQTQQCQYLGEIIAAEGVWYSYWFISNYHLTKGARDGLRNQAYELGGNIVQIEKTSLTYTTSTVFIGNVYHCPVTSNKHK